MADLTRNEYLINSSPSFPTVPAAPRSLTVSEVTPTNVTLHWAPPLSIPGLLKEYHIIAQLLSTVCEPNTAPTAQPPSEGELTPDCVVSHVLVSVNSSEENPDSITLHSLSKYRYYRFKVAAVTNAGVGEYTRWSYARTLAGSKNITVIVRPLCVASAELAVSQKLGLWQLLHEI